MRKLLLGLIGLLFAVPAVATDSGSISSVTVAGLVAQNGTPTTNAPVDIVSNNGVVKVSKNLFDYEYFYDNYQMYSPSSVGRCPIKLKPNTQYTISSNEEASSSSAKVFVVSGSAIDWAAASNENGVLVNSPRTVTTDSDGYLCLGFYVASGNAIPKSDFINGTAWVQIEQGTTATEYKPYGQIYTDGEVETITDSANHTATVATLLGVGDYRDTQNINTGAITRKVGVKVLDGTEDWVAAQTSNAFYVNDILDINAALETACYCTHFIGIKGNTPIANMSAEGSLKCGYSNTEKRVYIRYDGFSTASDLTEYLAEQYAAGTPVIIVYPLETATTESVAGQTMTTAPVNNRTGGVTGMTITTLLSSGASVVTTIAADAIKIATTAYNSARFSPVVTELNDTIATIRSVVTNTINQTKAIADLQATKQTRPDENCPAGKKCLLVEDDAGMPHWYEIIENAYGLPNGYTALEYLQSDGASYLIVPYRVNNKTVFYCRYNEIRNGPQVANAVFGVTTSPDTSKANNGILRLTGSSFNRMAWGNSVSGSVIDVSAPKEFNTWYEVLYDQNKLYQNDRLYATSATQTNVSWVAGYDLGVFARNSANVTMPAIAKISSVWAKENGEYKINLIPARRNSDSVLGMYDTVSGEFFTNKGSGTFTAGPDI